VNLVDQIRHLVSEQMRVAVRVDRTEQRKPRLPPRQDRVEVPGRVELTASEIVQAPYDLATDTKLNLDAHRYIIHTDGVRPPAVVDLL
jgi:hypothetical protein